MLLAELPTLGIPFPQLLLGTGIVLLVWLSVGSVLIFSAPREHRRVRRHWFSRWVYVAYLVLIGLLAVTSFGSILTVGHMSGLALLAHVAAAGGFVFLMVAIAMLYLPTPADEWDARYASHLPSWWATRWSAWALVASSLAAASTMLVSMLPVLDTQGLLDMAVLHRYAGLAVVASAILHVYSLACVRLGWR